MANEILWTLVTMLIPINTGRLLTAIFDPLPISRYLVNSLLTISIVHGLATVLATCLVCRPVAAARDNSVYGTCGDQIVAYVVLGSVGLLTDLVLVVLPPLLLRGLKLTWAEKADRVKCAFCWVTVRYRLRRAEYP